MTVTRQDAVEDYHLELIRAIKGRSGCILAAVLADNINLTMPDNEDFVPLAMMGELITRGHWS